MAAIVVIHGISQQFRGEHTLRERLFPALRDGVRLAGGDVLPEQVDFAAYGELFRPPAEVMAPDLYYDAHDVAEGYEQELLLAWWRRAAEVDGRVVPPDREVLARTPSWVSGALVAMSRSRFLSRVAEQLFIGDLKQVSAYFKDQSVRQWAREAVERRLAADTRVVVGHSLGSVVAYEALCAHTEWPVAALVTLGSPLGLPNLIFDRLRPKPGGWPGAVKAWTNVVDAGDVVAAVEDLRPLFGSQIRQIRVYNGSHAHDLRP